MLYKQKPSNKVDRRTSQNRQYLVGCTLKLVHRPSPMTKAGCWFGWVKGFFIFESKTQGRKRSKRWRWIFGRLKRKSYASIGAPQKRTLSEATEERRKHALTVAIATAAAAEAAVAAAHAAAEVVRLTTSSQSLHIFSKTDQNSAALKIQSAFRAHLARKALRALKGLVRLQAIARGRAVRRRINASLNRTRSETKGQTERPRKDTPTGQENEIKIENNSKRIWDGSILSKEEMEFSWLRKQEAIVKRERMKKYSFSHREKRNVGFLEETASNIESRPETSSCSGLTARFRPENERKQSFHEELSLGRRSFCHEKHNSAGDESLMPSSPIFPSYMAVTESVKAKTRSTSLPKQRASFLDGYSHCSVPSRDEPPSWLSYNGGLVRYA